MAALIAAAAVELFKHRLQAVSVLREQLNRPVSPVMQLRPGKNLVLVNLAEQLVADRLEAGVVQVERW